jgi:hypothetical protein
MGEIIDILESNTYGAAVIKWSARKRGESSTGSFVLPESVARDVSSAFAYVQSKLQALGYEHGTLSANVVRKF